MLQLSNIGLSFGKRPIFKELNCTIGARDRMGLVGANGAGKTTLLRLILGQQEPDEGRVEKPDYVTLGYLPQDGIETSGKSLYQEVEQAYGDVLELQKKIADAEEEMLSMDTSSEAYYDLIDQIGAWEQQLDDREPQKMRSRIERVLHGLGFSDKDFERDTGEFSGGWQMRIALAKLLLRTPSLLLLDEPTNHLDIVSQNWLEHYLQGYQGAIMVISHDRAFLDAVTDRTLEVKMGKVESFKGNYSFYVKEKAARIAAQRKARDNQEKEIARQKELINRFRGNVKKAGMVQSRIKQLDKMEMVEVEREEKKIFLRFPKAPPGSNKVVQLTNLHKSYGDLEIFKGLDLRIDPGDRIAVVGVNGAGKSTLARILAGVEPFQEGERETGLNTIIAYFAQQQAEELDPTKTVLEEVERSAAGNDEANPRGTLGALLFSGDDVFKEVKVLSGGERNRVALAKMLMQPANCLIFDEPTNHLDIRSKEALQEAIQVFEGTVILVSHDRAFLDAIVNKVLEVSPGYARMLTCNVTEYIERMEREMAANA
ncbi:MAG: ABC-F family ATP-binding cassette domain-containing protein [Verrucomicrobiota bacterium]